MIDFEVNSDTEKYIKKFKGKVYQPEIDFVPVSSSFHKYKKIDCWDGFSQECVTEEDLAQMDELTEWSFPLRLKRDYNISDDLIKHKKRVLSKSAERIWKNKSEKNKRKIIQYRTFLLRGRKLSEEQIQKMKKKKNMHKKYLYKNVPREVNYSGVVFE